MCQRSSRRVRIKHASFGGFRSANKFTTLSSRFASVPRHSLGCVCTQSLQRKSTKTDCKAAQALRKQRYAIRFTRRGHLRVAGAFRRSGENMFYVNAAVLLLGPTEIVRFLPRSKKLGDRIWDDYVVWYTICHSSFKKVKYSTSFLTAV